MRKPFVIHYSVLYLILINVFFSQSHDFSFIPIYSPFFTCFFFPKQNIMSAKLIIKNFPTYHVIVPSQLGIENSVIHGDFTSSKKKFKWAILIAVFVSCPLSAVPTYCSCVGYKLIGTLQMEKYTTVLPLSDGAQPAAVEQHRPCLLDVLLEKRAVWKKLQAT